jgi:hypothetical protein
MLKIRAIVLFLALCVLTFLILYIRKSFIIDNIAAFEILEERGEFGIYRYLVALQYFSIPIIYLWKFVVFALILWLGCFFFGYRVTYAQNWHVVIAAEFIFILPEIIKTGWFLLVETDPTYWDVRAFYPLSVMNLVNYENTSARWHYPFKALNVFEVVYWFLLVAGVHLKAGKRYDRAFVIVFSSYVFFFLVWLLYYAVVYK